jgi:nucleoside-diphosphate-sugar epimerase
LLGIERLTGHRAHERSNQLDVLITGGNGFLGRNLVLAVQGRGDTVRALASPTGDATWLEQRGAAIFRGDIRDSAALTAAMRGTDAVFHLVANMKAWGPIHDARAVNVLGTENVCRAAVAAGVRRLIHVSTVMVYHMAIGRPVTEDDPLAPFNEPYSVTKAEGDRLVQRMIVTDHLPAVIIRPGPLFGPGDRLNFGRMADRARAGKSVVVGSGDNAVPFVYVTDVVQALLLALDHDRAVGQAYNVGNDQPLTQGQYLSAIAQEIGVTPPSIHVPFYPMYAAAYAAERVATLSGYRIPAVVTRHGVKVLGEDSRMSIDKARRELGYEPQVSVREGVRLAAAWYQHQDSQTAP